MPNNLLSPTYKDLFIEQNANLWMDKWATSQSQRHFFPNSLNT